ncbi:DNA-3-methyladenine glycosylase family protein [Naasia lichenicola]|uniref:DNA-3-methyladenine glycosylase II n=1 Tax=Naasia lichenicola TaxID=2565933 RepID=A0A4S4FFV4_9MICO|nr:AlkA N-terminal domain-containing protein [Naasia lichenicola]THG28632.1 DNA-3-methyladenine glycosylase 2 family protein [Naasia lichenicola]
MSSSASTELELRFLGPYDVRAALRLLEAHAIQGAEVVDVDSASYRRLFPSVGGPVAASMRFDSERMVATVEAGLETARTLVPAIRHLFDLDMDPAALGIRFAEDPRIGPLIAARPGLRVIGHPNGWEAALTTVLGQQVSLAAARTFSGRLVARFGGEHGSGLRTFPPAALVAELDHEELRAAIGITRSRASTLLHVARAFADGLSISPASDPTVARRLLLAIPGVGPWTADYLAVRVLADRDAFPSGDLVLRKALGNVDAKTAEALSEPWRPVRAYALLHLWTSVAPSLG